MKKKDVRIEMNVDKRTYVKEVELGGVHKDFAVLADE